MPKKVNKWNVPKSYLMDFSFRQKETFDHDWLAGTFTDTFINFVTELDPIAYHLIM